MTLVRCARCDKPFCVRCLVDTPVGKKCRPCAENRTHLTESKPGSVLAVLAATIITAMVGAWLIRELQILLLAAPYGWVVGEVALRAGKRSRSMAVQVVTGVGAMLGGSLGMGFTAAGGMAPAGWHFPGFWGLAMVILGCLIAVSRVRYL